MIKYSTGRWSLKFLFRLHGSVFPKALAWALPAMANTVLIYELWFNVGELPSPEEAGAVGAIWSSFTFVLGFLVVFRTQQAYTRYWEGATLVQQARANFFNACSNVIAFCTKEKSSKARVEEFQHLLVRLISMLHCVGLQTVADMADVRFEFFNTEGLDRSSLRFLTSKSDKHQRCEIIIQWVQRLVVEGSQNGIVDVPAPILTRFFQELSQGSVQIINARNMTGIPFPFPYAQLLSALLVIHWLITPFFCAVIMKSPLWSCMFTFLCVFAFVGANYIAAEIESPFGDDANDLPIHALQKDMNRSLWILLDPLAQTVPKFTFDKEKHRVWDVTCQHNFGRMSSEDQELLMPTDTSTHMWTMMESQSTDSFHQITRLESSLTMTSRGNTKEDDERDEDMFIASDKSEDRSARTVASARLSKEDRSEHSIEVQSQTQRPLSPARATQDNGLEKASSSRFSKSVLESVSELSMVRSSARSNSGPFKDSQRLQDSLSILAIDGYIQKLDRCLQSYITEVVLELQHLQRNIGLDARLAAEKMHAKDEEWNSSQGTSYVKEQSTKVVTLGRPNSRREGLCKI